MKPEKIKRWAKGKFRISGTKPQKRLIIHAGTYKTGTTYFQQVAYENAAKLQEAGVLYPKTGLGLHTNHNRHAHRILGINLAKGQKNLFPEIVSELKARDDIHTALVSYEGFGHPANIAKLMNIRDCFEDIELHSILVFRPQIDLAISLYRELCQNLSLRLHFNHFINPETAAERYWPQSWNYKKIVTDWQSLAGKKNVHVLPYKKIRQNLVQGILESVGNDTALKAPSDPIRNISLSAPTAELIRQLNRDKAITKHRHTLGQELAALDALSPDFQDYVEVLQEEAAALEKAFKKDATFLKKHGFNTKAHLSAVSGWNWGNKLGVCDLAPGLQEKFVSHLKARDLSDLAKLVEQVDITAPESKEEEGCN